jgi:hypothetical protein
MIRRFQGFGPLLFLLPFLILNAIVALRLQPFFFLIRPGEHTSMQEVVLLALSLLAIPAGAFFALRPLLRRPPVRVYVLNGFVALLLLGVFGLLAVNLGAEVYACEVQQIPNCD